MADIETPDDVTALVERAKWAANAVYLAAEEGPATDLSRIIRGLLAALAMANARADREAKRADDAIAEHSDYVVKTLVTVMRQRDEFMAMRAERDREATARHEAEQEVSSVEAVLSETSAEANRRFDRYEADLAALRATLAEAAIPLEVLAHDGGTCLAPEVRVSVQQAVTRIRSTIGAHDAQP